VSSKEEFGLDFGRKLNFIKIAVELIKKGYDRRSYEIAVD
jgi:hypothetical protein